MQYLFPEYIISNVDRFKISMSIYNRLLYMYRFYHIYLELWNLAGPKKRYLEISILSASLIFTTCFLMMSPFGGGHSFVGNLGEGMVNHQENHHFPLPGSLMCWNGFSWQVCFVFFLCRNVRIQTQEIIVAGLTQLNISM